MAFARFILITVSVGLLGAATPFERGELLKVERGETAQARVEYAYALMLTGKFDAAAAEFQGVDGPAGWCGLADLEVLRGRWDEGENALARAEGVCKARVGAALARFRERFDEGLRLLDSVPASGGFDGEMAVVARAQLLVAKADYAGGVKVLQELKSDNLFVKGIAQWVTGAALRAGGKAQQADIAAGEALKLLGESTGEGSFHYAVALSGKGITEILLRQPTAQVKVMKALEQMKGLVGDYHLSMAEANNALGLYFYSVGKLKDAEEYIGRAIAIFDHLYPNGAETLVKLRANFASIYVRTQRYGKARAIYEEVVPWSREHKANDAQFATILRGYALALDMGGDKPRAIEILNEAIEVAKRTSNVDELIPLTGTLASVLIRTGSKKRGIAMLEEAAAMAKEGGAKYRGDHEIYLAFANYSAGKYEEALKFASQVVDGGVRKPHEPDYIQTMTIAANAELALGKLAEAEARYEKIVNEYKDVRFGANDDIIQAKNGLARAKWARGADLDVIAKALEEAATDEEELRSEALGFGSESQKETVAESLISRDLHLSFAIPQTGVAGDRNSRLAATAMLNSKARVAQEMRRLLNETQSETDEKTRALVKELQDVTFILSSIANGTVRVPKPVWEQLRKQKIEIESKLANAHLPEVEKENSLNVLQERLKGKRDVVVEITRFKRYSPKGMVSSRSEYGACAISAAAVKCRSLGDEAGAAAVNEAATKLAGMLAPVLPMAGARSVLHIAPDGKLNFVPFSHFTFLKTGWEGREVTLLSSGRRYGLETGPKELSPGIIVAASSYSGWKPGATTERGVQGLKLRDLPAAMGEAKTAQQILGVSKSQVFLGEAATEAPLKKTKRPQFLYVIAHGFSDVEGGRLRSGIVLPTKKRGKGGDDGVLSAEEIAVLDLRGTELVLLPVCYSGSGAAEGDWIAGIRRSLEIAGAEAQLLSLWSIDDKAAAKFMGLFLKHLVGKGRKVSKAAALRAAQQDMIAEGYKQPKYWAGFILSGNTQPLGKVVRAQ